MSARWTGLRHAATVVALLGALAGCSSSSGEDRHEAAATRATTAATATSSTQAATSSADQSGTADEPTDVATDPPVDTSGAGSSDLQVVVSFLDVAPGGAAVEGAGFVTEVVPGGGTCSLVLSRAGEADVRAEGEASAEPHSTACSVISVPVDRLAPGEWTGRLEFWSPTASGSSAPQTVVVP